MAGLLYDGSMNTDRTEIHCPCTVCKGRSTTYPAANLKRVA